jgi:glyoxylase-like metal-dependent hydrolase (beta-lactamase superfamily II)
LTLNTDERINSPAVPPEIAVPGDRAAGNEMSDMATMKAHRVGDATVIKIPERALDAAEPGVLYPPQVDAPTAVEETRKLWPGSVDAQTGLLRQSIYTWLVRTPTRVILVDTATGNDKDRPNLPILNHLSERFIDRLKAAGARPEEVDLVLHTHLDVDHEGWNTRKVDGRWVPTFPHARYVFSGRERAYLAALSASDGSDTAIRAEPKLGTMPHPPMLGIYEGFMRIAYDP